MSTFLERLSMSNMLNCTEQGQMQKYKTHAYNLIIRHLKQQVSKQACCNIQLRSKKKNKQTKNQPTNQTNKPPQGDDQVQDGKTT